MTTFLNPKPRPILIAAAREAQRGREPVGSGAAG